MVELRGNELSFSFHEVNQDARLSMTFQRTLRIPDDGAVYYLPPGLGSFPLRHVDDYSDRLPPSWREHGGVMLPMYQSEAMWINFLSRHGYPFLVKVGTGKINAVTGEPWKDRPCPDPQDYLVVPVQLWLDGFCVKKGVIRQFVAMPLGKGYTVEEQLTGKAEHGGLQIVVYPMKAEIWSEFLARSRDGRWRMGYSVEESGVSYGMGFAPGGRMKQDIYEDPYGIDAWDLEHGSRCFVHIANSLTWMEITGSPPPTMPPTAEQYTDNGLPWFDYYDENAVPLEGGRDLERVRSVVELGKEQGEEPIPENNGIDPDKIVLIRVGRGATGQGRENSVEPGHRERTGGEK